MANARARKALAPGSRIRVLVVDDSVVIRRLVTHALEEDPLVEVVGSAANGLQALARIPKVNPDVITLDLEMPEMDGLQALRRIRREYPDTRVVIFSTLTERGAAVTFEALALGADDYVTKASNEGSLDRSIARLRGELIPKLKQFFEMGAPSTRPAVSAPRFASRPAAAPVTGSARLVAIGISTGGPAALAALLPRFSPGFALPIVIVQHMPPLFTRFLAERLDAGTPLSVREAADGDLVGPGQVLLAPGDFHMRLRKEGDLVKVRLDQSPPENSCRPAVDVLFRSAAETYGRGVVAAVMTGMGQDGLRGAQTLRAAGASVIAQDEASSVVWGMPGAVVTAGLADSVIPLDGIVPEILRRCGGPAR